LDTDLSHIALDASIEALVVTDVIIAAETVVVSYDVHYRTFDGCKGLDFRSYLDRKVTGVRQPDGWDFLKFAMTEGGSTADGF
jgi:uncharacterized membrane protein